EGDDGVVERGLHMRNAQADFLALTLAAALLGGGGLGLVLLGCFVGHARRLLTSWEAREPPRERRPPAFSWPLSPRSLPFGYGRWCGSADRARADPCGDGCHGSYRYP